MAYKTTKGMNISPSLRKAGVGFLPVPKPAPVSVSAPKVATRKVRTRKKKA